MQSKATYVSAPDLSTDPRRPSVFLAGIIAPWRELITSQLSLYPVNILNPVRHDWDPTWGEDYADPRFAEQVDWELAMQEAADIIVVYFDSRSLSPISLMELGLAARTGKAIVCAAHGYGKKGNVEAVCRRFGVELVSDEVMLARAVERKLQVLLSEGIERSWV